MRANLKRAKEQLSELIESDASQRDALLTSWHIMRTGLQVLHRTLQKSVKLDRHLQSEHSQLVWHMASLMTGMLLHIDI